MEVCGILRDIKWKINRDPWMETGPASFIQGDEDTAYIKASLENDCDLEGEILEMMIFVPAPIELWVKVSALIDANNEALFLLPKEVIWYPGTYQIILMFTEDNKVKWSTSIPGYDVIANPLAEGPPPTILPGDEQMYLDLIADLNQENAEAVQNIADLERENAEAVINVADLERENAEAVINVAELERENAEAVTNVADLERENAEAVQNITDLNNAIGQVPGLIDDIDQAGTDNVNRVIAEGDTQVARVTNQGDTEVARVQAQGNASVQAVKDQETDSIIAVGDKGDEEYQRLNDLIQTSPTGGNAILLDGRTRTSFEEDIESRQYALDNRLVYVFEPGKRNIENLNYGMYVKNPLTNGDGTIKSEDADSMAGVFDDDNKNFYCGEGYENLTKGISDFSIVNATVEDLGNDRYKIISNGTVPFLLRYFSQDETKNLYSKFKILEANFSISQQIRTSFIVDGLTENEVFTDVSELPKIIDTGYDVTGVENDIRLRYINQNFDMTAGDYIILEKISTTHTDEVKQFVKDTAPDGKLIIKEPWTSVTHTIINLDENLLEQEYYADGTQVNLHLKLDGVTYNKYVSKSLVYEGILTAQEKADEISKITSGQYYIENTGVYEPVPKAKRRSNEYGQTKPYVMISSVNTDIQLVETDKVVYTELYDGTQQRARIDNVGAITGVGVVDVNGYTRLSAAPGGPVKVVIENV